jgi:hypothetical protein
MAIDVDRSVKHRQIVVPRVIVPTLVDFGLLRFATISPCGGSGFPVACTGHDRRSQQAAPEIRVVGMISALRPGTGIGADR